MRRYLTFIKKHFYIKKRAFILSALIFSFIFLTFSCVFSSQNIRVIKDQEYFPLLKETIKQAKSSIKVIAFEMGYYPEYPLSPSNILIQNLIAARKRGVDVRVILEKSEWNKKVTEKNRLAGKVLSRGKVKVRYDPPHITTHAKLVIIDSKIAILGSNNWTYYSLSQNKELALLVEVTSVVKELEEYFNSLWEESTPR
ncbi:hypothetical protein J7L81_03910 [Candidatus Aerophobetes bacterium]|nr:hypothetical protein [Candidatus Aerophobetes bacterium]